MSFETARGSTQAVGKLLVVDPFLFQRGGRVLEEVREEAARGSLRGQFLGQAQSHGVGCHAPFVGLAERPMDVMGEERAFKPGANSLLHVRSFGRSPLQHVDDEPRAVQQLAPAFFISGTWAASTGSDLGEQTPRGRCAARFA